MRTMFPLAFALALSAASCAFDDHAESEAAQLYRLGNQQLDEYDTKEGHKAKACGRDSDLKARCSWVWSRESAAKAGADALANCSRAAGGGTCYIFATDGTLSDWAREQREKRRSADRENAVLDGLIQGLGMANSIVGGGGGAVMPLPRATGGGAGGGGSGSNAGLCQQLRQAAATCYRQWQNLGGGSTGQAGSQKQCYDLNTAAARQRC